MTKLASKITFADKSGHTEVREDAPTNDQLKSVLDYAGDAKAGSVVAGATSISDAIRKAQQGSQIHRPLVVDWHKGMIGKSLPTCGQS